LYNKFRDKKSVSRYCLFFCLRFSLMTLNKIKKISRQSVDYSTFIKSDANSNLQKETLLNLYYLTKHYKNHKIQNNENSEKCSYKHVYNVRKRHNLHLLKIALLDNRPFKSSISVDQGFYNLQNFIFLLAMIKKRPEIVYFFLKEGFPKNINNSTFGTDLSPTYFQLACVLSGEIMRLLMDFFPSYSLTYNGLTPQMLLLNKAHFLYDKQEWCFLTTTQYELLNQYKSIKLIKNEENPIFLLDFLCMNNQVDEVRNLLKDYSELITYSKYCFVLNYNFKLMAILAENSINVNQTFCKLTPLHISAYINDINHAITSLMIKMDCNLQDDNGDTPLHIAARLKHYTLELFIRYGGNVNIKNNEGKTPKDFYDKNRWKMIPPNYNDQDVLVNIADMDYNNPEFHCSSVSMKHIMNIKNFKKPSRFKITSLLSFYSRENEVRKMVQRLNIIERYRYKTFKDLDSRFDQHLYKK